MYSNFFLSQIWKVKKKIICPKYQNIKTSKGNEKVLLILDQSKAYNVIPHDILLKKLQVLGFTSQALKLMRSFLSQWQQLVQLEATRSEILSMGPYSVIQGSTLSCILYLAYILDMPQLSHTSIHNPQEQEECKSTDLKTFVDDAFLVATKKPGQTFQEVVHDNMKVVEDYMKSNQLALNTEKIKIMLFTKDHEAKSKFKLEIKGKSIVHQKYAIILGNTLAEDLSWNHHVASIVIPALANWVRTIKLV